VCSIPVRGAKLFEVEIARQSIPLPLSRFSGIFVPEIAQTPRLIRFESFEVNLRTGELRKKGEKAQ